MKDFEFFMQQPQKKPSGFAWLRLSGKGSHRFEYALAAHEADWDAARTVQSAWEFNCPVTLAGECAVAPARSFLGTSDNVLVEVMRRDGADIEVRLVECLGQAGDAWIALYLPHEQAVLTDLLGRHPTKLEGGPKYTFSVRPQQIATLRFRTSTTAPRIEPLLKGGTNRSARKTRRIARVSQERRWTPAPRLTSAILPDIFFSPNAWIAHQVDQCSRILKFSPFA